MSCENNTLDLSPGTLIIKKELGDTLLFSCTITDTDDVAIDLSGATDIDYYLNDVLVASLGSGVTLSGAGSNVITISHDIASEAVGTMTHELIITHSDATIRTYFEGRVKIS